MKHSFVLLVIAVFGLPVPVLAQGKEGAKQGAPQATGLCDESATLGVEQPQGLLAVLCDDRAGTEDRWYLLNTAASSATMTRQGRETAIARLNPRFAARLANAIREARTSGLSSAGILSGYRPPAFGVGRFLDKFRSLHAYGLAVDMFGIGQPGSKEAKVWYDIAGRHGIVCPYGVDSRREWDHCQATPIRVVCPDNPLRETIVAEGPLDLAEMFRVGDLFVDNAPAATCLTVAANQPAGSELVRPQAAHAVVAAPSARSDRRHLREARNVADGAVTRARRLSDDDVTRIMVADDPRPGESHRKPRRR